MDLVLGITIVLFAWAVALSLMAVSLRVVRTRKQRRRRGTELTWRGYVDALVLDGAALPLVPRRDRSLVLDLLLRYRALLRGPEAERITRYLEDQGYVAAAVGDLSSRNRWRRAAAAVRLGEMRSEAAVPGLVSLMEDESDDVRMVAARSLAAIGDPAAVGALAAALADPSRWTASTVAADLVEMGPVAVPTLIAIAGASGASYPGAHEAAVTAIRVLGEIRDPAAAPVLVRQLEEAADLNMRARAAAALGTVGGPLASPALRAALGDPAWQVRAQAATSLGALGDRASVPDLSAAIEDREWWVRRNCAEALARLGGPGRDALTALADSPDPFVRDRCRATLERVAPHSAGGPGGTPA
jgi:HEAT repeat protein